MKESVTLCNSQRRHSDLGNDDDMDSEEELRVARETWDQELAERFKDVPDWRDLMPTPWEEMTE